MILGFENYKDRVEFGYNGEDAVKKVKQAFDENDPFRFPLILMDCNMPFMDGYEATRQIRQLFTNHNIQRSSQPRIIAITGHVEQEYVKRALSSGMDKVYPKPFPIKQFGKILLSMKLVDKVPFHLKLDESGEEES